MHAGARDVSICARDFGSRPYGRLRVIELPLQLVVNVQYVYTLPTGHLILYLKCADATSEYNQTCEVGYLDTVALHCPEEGNSSSWFMLAGRSVLVCNHSVCSLAEVTQWSTGLYFCRRTFTVEIGEKARDYFVNLIVLGKP